MPQTTKTPQAREDEKYEKTTKSPILCWAPKAQKKTPKNYENGHFLTVFVIFLVVFLYFQGPTRNGDFVNFPFFFRIAGIVSEALQGPSSRTYPSGTRPSKPLCKDLIWT